MANIRKRENTYQIRVSCGYNSDGEQVMQFIEQLDLKEKLDKFLHPIKYIKKHR